MKTMNVTIDHLTKEGVGVTRIEKKPMQFLYKSGEDYVFMNMDDYSQVEINSVKLGNDTKFLKENLKSNHIL